MQASVFRRSITNIAQALKAGKLDSSLNLCRQLSEKLKDDESANPDHLGWAKYYTLQTLFAMQRYCDCIGLVDEIESKDVSITLANRAWMHTIAGESASKLSLVDSLVDHGKKSLELLRQDQNPIAELQTGQLICDLLSNHQREDLNHDFAVRIVKVGIEYNAEKQICSGIQNLAKNFRSAGSLPAETISVLREGAYKLKELSGSMYRDEIAAALKAFQQICPDDLAATS